MPAGLIPNEGIAAQLLENLGTNAPSVTPWMLMLFQNDFTPDAATVFADLTPCDFDGYDPVVLSRDQWQTPTLMSGCAHTQWGTTPIVWFVLGGPPQTPFGVAYYDPVDEVLRFVQRFDDADLEPVAVGGKVTLLPQYTMNSSEC